MSRALPHRRRVKAALAAALAIDVGIALVTTGVASAAPASPTRAPESTAAASKAQAFATLKILKPNVSVRRKGKSLFKPAHDGQKLRVGDTIQTDAAGQAEVDYTESSFTRLDVKTTFTIKHLTDNQGHRQVEGSLDTGRTWNRTSALTQSESFSQTGAGATASVVGSAYMVECDAAGHCTFTSVVDGLKLVTVNGEVKLLTPLQACDSTKIDPTNANLCGVPTQVTADVLAANAWIQENLFFDGKAGYPGPTIVGTIVVTNGVVTSFTPAPAPAPAPNAVTPTPGCSAAASSPPVVFDGSPGTGSPPANLGTCAMTSFGSDPQPLNQSVSSVTAPGGGSVTFSVPLMHSTIGNGWATWSNGYTGDVYRIPSSSPVTLTMPSSTLAFYFYAEPNRFNTLNITATAQDGTTSGAVPVKGSSGATYFGFYSTSTPNPIVSITASIADSQGMAIGEFAINQGPGTTSAADQASHVSAPQTDVTPAPVSPPPAPVSPPPAPVSPPAS